MSHLFKLEELVISIFKVAEYGFPLKATSFIITIFACGLGIFILYLLFLIPSEDRPLGITIIILMSFLLIPSTIIGTYLFSIKGYAIDGEQKELVIYRMIDSKTISIRDVKEVRCLDKDDLKGMTRTFGIGGLYSYSGTFYAPKLGAFQMYSSDNEKLVLIKTISTAMAISPKDTEAFINTISSIIV